jgi:serine/threonine protein kinase
VYKSATAHIFHVGDARLFALVDDRLEQLTEDHRRWLSGEKSYLSRALGVQDWLEIDYRTLALDVGDTFVLATDGVYEFASETFMVETITRHADDLDAAARRILDEALEQGSDDNLTIQIVRVEALPQHDIGDLHQQAAALPFPPALGPRMEFDGYRIVRELHHSSRSHVYLALDTQTGLEVALKTPSVDLRDDPAYLERFLMEEWVARRVDNAHVLKPCAPTRKRNYLYTVTEFIEGQTLSQWMIDNPTPDLETVRGIVEQIAKGLQALHRREMLHQDLRPNNVLIDKTGTVKLIDFGSVRVAGVAEIADYAEEPILGTAQYTAPEYFLGEPGTSRSDLYALGVIAFQMLSGRVPYGTRVARATTRAAQRRLVYASVLDDERTIPAWVDEAIRKAVHPDPLRRYEEVSEFVEDLRRPNHAFVQKGRPPLLERNPIMFWKGLSLALFLGVIYLASTHPLFSR